MVKFTVNELYTIHENLGAFIAENSQNVIGKAAVAAHFNFRVIHDALGEYMTERDKIIAKHGTTDEATQVSTVEVDSEEGKAAIAEIEEIGKLEVELPVMLISTEDLYAVAEAAPSANIGILIWMTKEYRDTLKTEDKKD